MSNFNIERYSFITKDQTTILSKDITVFNGIEVKIQLDIDEGHKFWFIRNNNTYEYDLKGFQNNFKTKTLTIEWVEIIKDHKNVLLNSKSKFHIENNTPFYETFNLSPGTVYFHAKQCINKVMEIEIKVVCFNLNGEFQPLPF